nr:MAG TPA: hypothetical protein [Bacteriophage sp.]
MWALAAIQREGRKRGCPLSTEDKKATRRRLVSVGRLVGRFHAATRVLLGGPGLGQLRADHIATMSRARVCLYRATLNRRESDPALTGDDLGG